MKNTVRIVNRTKQGYIECMDRGGGLCLTASGSSTRRGRVIKDGRIAPTLDTSCRVGVVEIEVVDNAGKTASLHGKDISNAGKTDNG